MLEKGVLLAAGLACLLTGRSVLGAHRLPAWHAPDKARSTSFELGEGKGEFRAWGRGRDMRMFFGEFLPAVFERTLVLEELAPGASLEWIFTGEMGGFTVSVGPNDVAVYQRFYDSPAFESISKSRTRHPQWNAPTERVAYEGALRAVTVTMDYKLGLSLALNGREVLRQDCLLDISRHQLALSGKRPSVRGRMLEPEAEPAVVRVDPAVRRQTMTGFGGIATPTAYAQLSPEGKQRWWRLVREYNLLIQREYPIGTRLNPDADNWDRLEDATPHYYGDNFPNGEISDFEYIRNLRRLGGKVWFEFWALPDWVGKDPKKYAKAMVSYCRVSRQKAGAPPDVVGIQNEVDQSASMFHEMTLELRKQLDEAGFGSVRIHMSDSGSLAGGIRRAEKFRKSDAAWAKIDFSATHMYDYQGFFTNPDGFDGRLKQWKKLTGDKPFLSTELCINNDRYQWPSYRVALAMGQLYHKNLVLTDATAVCYCWTLLNVVQPSYGWTRTLCVPDARHGFVPTATSHQLRVFGAYSRRIREGMVRVEAKADVADLLVSAFAGKLGKGTVVVLNRSVRPRRLRAVWPGVRFTEMEAADPYRQNELAKAPGPAADGTTEVIIEPGAIVTLSNVALAGAVTGAAATPDLPSADRSMRVSP
ncbi:MAG: hypothetical protein JSU94_19550 [Phycisphaerales bacterium]|nr:MAG: hypothetical protein JSU94_19550 [Phycisphaerales bacterium]